MTSKALCDWNQPTQGRDPASVGKLFESLYSGLHKCRHLQKKGRIMNLKPEHFTEYIMYQIFFKY